MSGMGMKSALGLGQPGLPGRQTAVGAGDWGSPLATELCGELWCPSARRQPCRGVAEGEGCGREKRKSAWAGGEAGTGTVPHRWTWIAAGLLPGFCRPPWCRGKQKCRPA